MEYLIIVFLALLTFLVFWSILSQRRFAQELKNLNQPDQSILLLNQHVNQLTMQINSQLNSLTDQLNQRLGEANKTLGERLDNAAKIVIAVQNKLGQLDEANKRIYEIGKDISSLQDILRAPKLRGGLGELLLEDLLNQILPPNHFKMQYTFKSGEKVDAVVILGEGFVPIDSKFPLENLKKSLASQSESEKKSFRKLFTADVKKHIENISRKYILPDEGTFNFALMYIPAENIYYETIIRDENFGEDKSICQYALEKKVIPVSPNSFYAYLQAILLGLKGMKIEENARDILANLGRLSLDLQRFREDFDKIGKHLSNSRSSFDQAEKRLDKLSDKLLEFGEVEGRKSLDEVTTDKN